MLRIALCDDEEKHLEKMNALLESYLQSRPHLNGQVELFSSGRTLLTHREKQGGFDLYILDILMPSASGIDIARRLRALGDGGEIIYLTHSNDFASDSYDVRAFFYLLKPVTERKFFQVLDEAVEKSSKRKNQAVMVHTTEGTQRILLDRIRYVERVGRCMRYYCTDGIIDSQTIRVNGDSPAGRPALLPVRGQFCAEFPICHWGQWPDGFDGQRPDRHPSPCGCIGV